MGDTRLDDLATELLASAAATLDDPPERQYVAPGPESAVECELLRVTLIPFSEFVRISAGVAPSTPDSVAFRGVLPVLPTLAWEVTLARECAPIDTDRTATDIDDYSRQILTDYQDLWRGLAAAANVSTLFGTLSADCDGVEVGALEPAGPSGGMAWANITIRHTDLGDLGS